MAELDKLKQKFVAGAVVGNIAVAGIALGDRIISVIGFGLTEGVPNTFSGIVDLTAEFKVTAAGIINNAGGTSSAAKILFVQWEAKAGGRVSTTGGRSSY